MAFIRLCRLIAVDLSKQKELEAYPKAIQQIEFVGQSKKLGDGDNAESIFISTILEKIKEAKLKLSQRRLTVLQKMANYQEVRIKLTNLQLKKL